MNMVPDRPESEQFKYLIQMASETFENISEELG
jgi:hypothetical protein